MVPDEVVVGELCGRLNHAVVPQVLETQDTEMIGCVDREKGIRYGGDPEARLASECYAVV